MPKRSPPALAARHHLKADQRIARDRETGCIAGAPSFAEYRAALAAAGFEEIAITTTHQAGPGVHSAIIRADKRPDIRG